MGGDFLGGGSSGTQSGTSSGTSSTTSPYAAPLANIGTLLTNVGSPLTSLAGSQYLEALRTGGVNSFLPFITRALDAVRSQGSESVQNLRQMLARSGLGRTGLGQADLAQAQQQAGQNVASTPMEFIQQTIQNAGGFGANLLGAATGALSNAGSLSRSTMGTSTETGTTGTTRIPGLLDWFQIGAGSPGLAGGISDLASSGTGTGILDWLRSLRGFGSFSDPLNTSAVSDAGTSIFDPLQGKFTGALA